VAYPYPPAQQPTPHGWQPQPLHPYGYAQPPAQHPAYSPAPPQPLVQPQAYFSPPQPEPREMSPIEEVRESLREFRDAIRDIAADRARRRYS
jgi:succinoglycan biosynthesis transport protein ExoP